MSLIRLNQMGFLPDGQKRFVYAGKEKEFMIYDADHQKISFRGILEKLTLDEASKEYVCFGDFSSLKTTGQYYIKIGDEVSRVFSISGKQTETCTDALIKAFYYQRCGMELTKEFAGPWEHPACHLQPSYVFRQDAEELLRKNPEQLELIDTAGGWHDAGDYGRYTVAAAKAVADLMLAYEHFQGAFDHTIDIPESKLKGSDILHEVKYELDFMLKMQRASDGSAYTKVATRYFPGMIMPHEDTEPLFIFDISSPATAAFAASMAMAARIYQQFDGGFAKKCLAVAEKAYQWLKQNPEPLFFHNPANIRSGEYGDDVDLDERYWAAAEMYRTTGKEEYHNDFLMYYLMLNDKLSLGWRQVGGYGTISYLTTVHPVNLEVYNELKKEWLKYADELDDRSKKDGYGITLALDEYKWGSTMILLNQGMHLIIANKLLNNTKYDSIIQNNWDYLFGMNPMDISYVTGLGEQVILYPHHRPSAADGVEAPIPGMVSGGPCNGFYDEVARKYLKGLPPAKCFIDHTESFSTNEITIYWNSPAVYVGAYLCRK